MYGYHTSCAISSEAIPLVSERNCLSSDTYSLALPEALA